MADYSAARAEEWRQIVVATRNRGKAREIRAILEPFGFSVQTLNDLAVFDGFDVEETGSTFVANALLKAEESSALCGGIVVADDSGLVVDALGGAPGVYSARYSGPEATDHSNNDKLIEELKNVDPEERTARFVCSVVLFIPNDLTGGPFAAFHERAVEFGDTTAEELGDLPEGVVARLEHGVAVGWSGTIEGVIIDESRGENGFGYDPHFFLPSHGCTTAELPPETKNDLSHRGEAFRKLAKEIGG